MITFDNRFMLLTLSEFMEIYNDNYSRYKEYLDVVITENGSILLPIFCGHMSMLGYYADFKNEYPAGDLVNNEGVPQHQAINELKNFHDTLDSSFYFEELMCYTKCIIVSYDNQVIINNDKSSIWYSEGQKRTYEFLVSRNLIIDNIRRGYNNKEYVDKLINSNVSGLTAIKKDIETLMEGDLDNGE